MEKKTMPKVLALLLAVALVCTSIITVPSTEAQAATKASKITLTAKKQTLYVGKSKGSFTLKVKSVKPAKADKKVTYKSSKPGVASVNSKGKVTAKSVGTTKITVTSKSNKKAKAVCTVTVKEGVKQVQAPKELILKTGGKATVTLGFTPSKAGNAKAKEMNISSSKKNIATASAGKKNQVTIKAKKKAGKANITIQPKDGSAKKVTIKLTVKKKVTTVKKIKLNKSALSLNAGATETLKATLTPKKPDSKKVNWVSSDESVAKVDKNGKVTAIGNGSATIIATAVSGGKSATCKVNVTTAPAGITLDQQTLALQIGTPATLTATVAPETVSDPTVTWTVDHPEIVTVAANGAQAVVTPVAAGTANVTATTVNGLSATCVVTVASGETKASDYADGFMTINLDKTADIYKVQIPGKKDLTVDAPSLVSDYGKFVAELKKDIWTGNFFKTKWKGFAQKFLATDSLQVFGLVTEINVDTTEDTITVTGKTEAGAEKTVTIVRSNDTENTCTLTITAGTKTVTLSDVTVAKVDGKVTIDANIQRDGKDPIKVTTAMTETETQVYLYGGEYSVEKSIMTFKDNAETNMYNITINGTNYENIKKNLNLSLELKDITVWNVK